MKRMVIVANDPRNLSLRAAFLASAYRAAGYEVVVEPAGDRLRGTSVTEVWTDEDSKTWAFTRASCPDPGTDKADNGLQGT